MFIDNFCTRAARVISTLRSQRSVRFAAVFFVLGAVALGVALSGRPGAEPEDANMAKTDGIALTDEQQKAAEIEVEPIHATPMRQIFRAPGEVQTNNYTTGIVAARVTATVVSRAARLGDAVQQGQSLITLYSQDVADAQSAYLLAQRNLSRLVRIREVIAEQQVDEARAKMQEAKGRLESYGLTASDIAALKAKGLENIQTGQFVLSTPAAGTVIEDNFKVGDVVEAGKPLFQVADLKDVWVEAHVSPDIAAKQAGEDAKVIAGDATYGAQIIQKHDTVDETTRTVDIRLKLDNSARTLRPGQFVDVELYGPPQDVLNLPTSAVLRNAAGHWVVFVHIRTGVFVERPVKVLFTSGDRTAIQGLAAGTPVVTSGAFFVMSEAAKASFGEDE